MAEVKIYLLNGLNYVIKKDDIELAHQLAKEMVFMGVDVKTENGPRRFYPSFQIAYIEVIDEPS